MRLTINATSAKMGGAATYLSNVLPEMARQMAGDSSASVTIWGNVASVPDGPFHARHQAGARAGGLRRLFFDQVTLPRMLRREGQDVLFSSANIGPLRCPCRQVLLVRNPIYFSPEYERRMTNVGVRLRLRLQRWLTLQAVRRADHVLFPTRAMMDMVARYTKTVGTNWSVAPYGTRHDLFTPRTSGRDTTSEKKPVRLLHVSHYCDQKDLGTLLWAVRMLNQKQPGRYQVTVTAGMETMNPKANPHCPALPEDRRLFQRLAEAGCATDLGSVPYEELPAHYRQADIFVFPSYTESFGHPLVEAMASGLPVIASDAAVNREMCGDAAIYHRAFDATALAERIAQVTASRSLLTDLRQRSLRRAKDFTWEAHVRTLLDTFGYQYSNRTLPRATLPGGG